MGVGRVIPWLDELFEGAEKVPSVMRHAVEASDNNRIMREKAREQGLDPDKYKVQQQERANSFEGLKSSAPVAMAIGGTAASESRAGGVDGADLDDEDDTPPADWVPPALPAYIPSRTEASTAYPIGQVAHTLIDGAMYLTDEYSKALDEHAPVIAKVNDAIQGIMNSEYDRYIDAAQRAEEFTGGIPNPVSMPIRLVAGIPAVAGWMTNLRDPFTVMPSFATLKAASKAVNKAAGSAVKGVKNATR